MEELVLMGSMDKDKSRQNSRSQPLFQPPEALLSVILHKHYLWPSQEANGYSQS